MPKFLKNTVASRLAGERPSPVKAAVVAAVAGIAVAAITYRVLRS